MPPRAICLAFLLMNCVLVSFFAVQGEQGLPGPRGPSGAVGEPGRIVSHTWACVWPCPPSVVRACPADTSCLHCPSRGEPAQPSLREAQKLGVPMTM